MDNGVGWHSCTVTRSTQVKAFYLALYVVQVYIPALFDSGNQLTNNFSNGLDTCLRFDKQGHMQQMAHISVTDDAMQENHFTSSGGSTGKPFLFLRDLLEPEKAFGVCPFCKATIEGAKNGCQQGHNRSALFTTLVYGRPPNPVRPVFGNEITGREHSSLP